MNWGDFMSEVLNNLGYDLKAQERILNSHAVNRYSLHTLEKLVVNTFNYFKGCGYSGDEIISMTTFLPSLFNYTNETLDERFKLFKKLDFSSNELLKMTLILPQLLTISDDYILEKYKLFEGFGYSSKNIHDMTVLVPSIFSNSKDSLINKRRFFIY